MIPCLVAVQGLGFRVAQIDLKTISAVIFGRYITLEAPGPEPKP